MGSFPFSLGSFKRVVTALRRGWSGRSHSISDAGQARFSSSCENLGVCVRAEVGVGGEAGAATRSQSVEAGVEAPRHLAVGVTGRPGGIRACAASARDCSGLRFALARSRRVQVRSGLRRAGSAAARAGAVLRGRQRPPSAHSSPPSLPRASFTEAYTAVLPFPGSLTQAVPWRPSAST